MPIQQITSTDIASLPTGSVGATQLATGSVESYLNTQGSAFGFRNRIINGAMMIDQRNAGASVTPNTSADLFPCDRFAVQASQNSKCTAQQTTVAPPGFKNSLKITSSSAYSVGTNDYFDIYQKIEGYNVADMGFGTSSAATFTISFWVQSSLTGTFGGSVYNNAFNRSYPFSYTITNPNTWEQKTVTIAGDQAGTWTNDNTCGLGISFSFGVGTTYSGTAGAWVSSGKFAPSGAVSVVGTSGAVFYLTGVQLEKGSTASPFEYRDYGRELQLCQRYFEKMGGDAVTDMYFNGYQSSSTDITWPIYYKTNKRSAPTATVVGTWNTGNNGGINVQGLGLTTCTFRLTATSTGVTFAHTTGTSTYLTFSSEL